MRNSIPIGIDLGTTYSAVAYIDSDGRPATIVNSAGDLLTPTAILVEDGEIIIGKEAVKSSAISPTSFADCFKRDMGAGQFRRELGDLSVPPEVLSALVLDKLKSDAERKLGEPVKDVVITVPAFFDESRRKATQDAGRLAGLNVLDIINEPTAAAVAYGYACSKNGQSRATEESTTVLVYDLGGGTFDVTLLEASPSELRTLATDGDVRLGGKDFDGRIVNHISQQFRDEHGLDPLADPSDAAQLWIDAQEAKHALSERSKTTVICYHSGMRLRTEVTRETFESLTLDLLQRTESTTAMVLDQAGIKWSDIDEVLLVGGSSRMPMVVRMLAKLTGKEPNQRMEADEAVAHGAAIYCRNIKTSQTNGKAKHQKLINVNSHSLGAVGRGARSKSLINRILIPRNTPLPCHVKRVFPMAKTGQRSIVVPVVEGESPRPKQCIQLGKCVIDDLPPGLPKGTQIEVRYSYSADGRISVSARVPSTRQSATVELKRTNSRELGSLETWRHKMCSIVSQDSSLNDSHSLYAIKKPNYLKLGKDATNADDLDPELQDQANAVKLKMAVVKKNRARLKELEALAEFVNSSSETRIMSAESARLKDENESLNKVIRLQLTELGKRCASTSE